MSNEQDINNPAQNQGAQGNFYGPLSSVQSPEDKGRVVRFLYEGGLIHGDEPLVKIDVSR